MSTSGTARLLLYGGFNQVSAILDVLGVESRGQAIVRAREAGFGK